MKKILLTAAVTLLGISGMEAQVTVKDPGVYTFNDTEQIGIKSDWIVSNKVGNYSTADAKAYYPFAANSNSRAMTILNGKMYVGRRVLDANSNVVSLAIDVVKSDGVFEKTITLPDNVFKKNGAYMQLPLNSLRTDAAGNLVMMNYTPNIQTSGVQVWAMAGESATPQLILDYAPNDFGFSSAMRIDFFSVYGNVFADGYIIGGVAGTDNQVAKYLAKWDIENGSIVTETPGYCDLIELQEFCPVMTSAGSPILALGTAPFIAPLSANTFYVDGQATRPALYDMDGNIVSHKSFNDVPASNFDVPNTSANGVLEFTLGTNKYLLTGLDVHNNTTAPCTFALYKLGDYGFFENITKLYTFPTAGFGATTNSTSSMLAFFEKVDEHTGHLYVWAYLNGFARYTISNDASVINTGINDVLADQDAVAVYYQDGQFVFSSEVASVVVYSITGSKVAEAANVSELAVSVPEGVYVVKATSLTGEVNTQKVLVK